MKPDDQTNYEHHGIFDDLPNVSGFRSYNDSGMLWKNYDINFTNLQHKTTTDLFK